MTNSHNFNKEHPRNTLFNISNKLPRWFLPTHRNSKNCHYYMKVCSMLRKPVLQEHIVLLGSSCTRLCSLLLNVNMESYGVSIISASEPCRISWYVDVYMKREPCGVIHIMHQMFHLFNKGMCYPTVDIVTLFTSSHNASCSITFLLCQLMIYLAYVRDSSIYQWDFFWTALKFQKDSWTKIRRNF